MTSKVKGQVSIEFIIVLAITVLIFMVMGIVIYQKYSRTAELKISMHGNRVARMIADNINEISAVGSGYSLILNLPARLEGGWNYTISFFRSEPTVFMHGGGFIRGDILYWSAPLYTENIVCLLPECNNLCNATPDETCLKVGDDSIDVRVVNEDGIIFLTRPYNLRQGNRNWIILPYRGNNTYSYNNSCIVDPALIADSSDSRMYLYKNTQDKSISLVFKHGQMNDENDTVQLRLYDILGDAAVNFSDDGGELNLLQNMTGNWSWGGPDYCDGGIMVFRSKGAHVCISPGNITGGVDWYWLNGDESKINLSKEADVCISYP